VLAALVLLAGCATIQTSPLNPLNWFGTGSSPGTATEDGAVYVPPSLVPPAVDSAPDPRLPVERVLAVSLDRSPDAILVTAEGQTSAPGHFNAALVPTGIDGGYLVLEFRAEPPPAAVAGLPSLTSGFVLDNSSRAGLRGLRVVARQNAITRSF
jgi:hypothetical protein